MIHRWQIYFSVAFFGLILLIGILSQVSFSVALSRAIGWTLAVFVLTVINTQMLLLIVDQNIKEHDQEHDQEIDIILPAEQAGEQQEVSTAKPGNMSGSQQIEKDIEEMVKNDPVRVADLTRKMGLD